MTNPSHLLQLDAGTYWICTCGRSSNSPYCNGAHKGSPFQPMELELEAPTTIEISGAVRTESHPPSV